VGQGLYSPTVQVKLAVVKAINGSGTVATNLHGGWKPR
jgi:hypothetical protein